jgi:pyrimidine operon attenuation protein/uracil phosphoribosyltransferase
MSEGRVLIEGARFDLTIDRLCHQVIERFGDFSNTRIIGIQPRGVLLSDRIVKRLKAITGLETLSMEN